MLIGLPDRTRTPLPDTLSDEAAPLKLLILGAVGQQPDITQTCRYLDRPID